MGCFMDDEYVGVPSVQVPGPLFEVPRETDLFLGSKIRPTVQEAVVAGIILARRGHKAAVKLRDVMAAIGEKDERVVRGIVEQLIVTHRLRIGSCGTGYYAIETAEDLDLAIGRYKSQVISMWRRLRVLADPHALAELHGQLELEDGK